jgi:hypothetical protein
MTTYDIAPKLIGEFIDVNLPYRPVFFHGPPGIGKTQKIKEYCSNPEAFKRIAEKHLRRRGIWGQHKDEIASIAEVRVDDTLRLGNVDLLDLGGLPYVEEGVMKRAVPEFWLGVKEEGKVFGFLYLDEYTHAGREKQTAAQQLIDNGTSGNYRLPGHSVSDPDCELGLVFIIASGNRQSDKSNSHGMGNQTGTRFTHATVSPTSEGFVEGWLEWAAGADVHPSVLAFIRQSPGDLFNLDPNQKEEHPTAATPRTWEAVSHIVKDNPPISIEFASYAGIVGEQAARSFVAILHAARSINVDEALVDPANASIPAEIGHQFAAASLLIRRATIDNFDNVIEYVERIGDGEFSSPEIAVFVVDAIVRRQPVLAETSSYRDFTIRWSEISS